MKRTVSMFIFVVPFLLAVHVESGAVEAPSHFYRVQVGAEDLETLKAQLESEGWSPLSLEEERGESRLFVGEFEYCVDAVICASHFVQSYRAPAVVVSATNVEGATSFAGVKGALPRIFHQPERHMGEVPNLALPEEDPLVANLQTLQESSDKEAYRQDLVGAINVLEATDVRKGFALTRKGILDLLDRNFEDSLQSLRQVANGEVVATRVDRIKAMRRVAWILHQQWDRLKAYQAYREMGAFTGSDLMRATAAVECAGLLMELARHHGIGDLSECRRECQKALEIADEEDPDFRQLRATAELMFMETFYYEGRNEVAAGLADSFVLKYPDRSRELPMALLFQACAYKKLGNYEKAKAALLQVLKTEWSKELQESWGSGGQRWDMKWKAAGFLRDFATQFNDPDGIAVAEDYMRK